MPYPKEENNRLIALLHLLVHKRILTKQEATDFVSKWIPAQFLKRWQKRLDTSGMDCNKGDNLKIKKPDKDEKITNELRIEINDSSSTHNNNFAITLKSKNVDVDKLLPMAEAVDYGSQTKGVA